MSYLLPGDLAVGGLYEYRSDFCVTRMFESKPKQELFEDYNYNWHWSNHMIDGALYIADLFCVIEVSKSKNLFAHKIITTPQAKMGWVVFDPLLQFKVRG